LIYCQFICAHPFVPAHAVSYSYRLDAADFSKLATQNVSLHFLDQGLDQHERKGLLSHKDHSHYDLYNRIEIKDDQALSLKTERRMDNDDRANDQDQSFDLANDGLDLSSEN